MFFQRGSELAIRAILFLARQAPGKLSPAHEIAAHADASEAYLAKVLRRLTAAGLVRAFRGPGRGAELGRAPEEITLGAVVWAMEEMPVPDMCVLEGGFCSEVNPCPLHERWAPLRAKLQRLLEETTVSSLIQQTAGEKLPEMQFVQVRRGRAILRRSMHTKTPEVSSRPRRREKHE